MEYHSQDWHERQCHSVSEHVVLLSFMCKHLPVKRQKGAMCPPESFFFLYPFILVLRGLSLHSRMTGLTPLPCLSVDAVVLTHHQSLARASVSSPAAWPANAPCFCRCLPHPLWRPAQSPKRPSEANANVTEINPDFTNNIIRLFSRCNVSGLMFTRWPVCLLAAPYTVGSFSKVEKCFIEGIHFSQLSKPTF